jgi:hypothetical protein
MHPRSLWLAVSFMSVLPLGCRPEPSAAKKEAPPAAKASNSAEPVASRIPFTGATDAEVQAFLDAPRDSGLKFTPPLQEALLAKLHPCPLDAHWPQTSCEPFKRWRQATAKASLDGKAKSKQMALKYLASDKPAVQCVAASILAEAWEPDMGDALIDAAQAQRDPAVAACIVRHGHTVWMTSSSAKTTAFLLSMTEHADERVRMRALDEVLRSPSIFGKPFPDAVSVAGKRLEVDPALPVRAHICKQLFNPEDERAIAIMEKALKSPGVPPELAKACFEGIVSAWAQRPRRKKPSRAAYDLTLATLQRKPRAASIELVDGLGGIGSATAEPGGVEEETWSKEVKPWLDPTRIRAALEEFAADPAVGEEARYAALDSLDKLKAPASTFVRLRDLCKRNGDQCRGRASGVLLDEKAGGKAP